MKNNPRCLLNCIRKRIDLSKEYTATHLKYQAILFIAVHAQFFHRYLHRFIFYAYNNPLLKKNFSLKSYLKWLMEKDSWVDEAMLYVISIMWDLTISILFPKTIRTLHIRHSTLDLKKVDVVVLSTGGTNFTAIGKGRLRLFSGRLRGERVVFGEERVAYAVKLTSCKSKICVHLWGVAYAVIRVVKV